jgi:hypothetical protein
MIQFSSRFYLADSTDTGRDDDDDDDDDDNNNNSNNSKSERIGAYTGAPYRLVYIWAYTAG